MAFLGLWMAFVMIFVPSASATISYQQTYQLKSPSSSLVSVGGAVFNPSDGRLYAALTTYTEPGMPIDAGIASWAYSYQLSDWEQTLYISTACYPDPFQPGRPILVAPPIKGMLSSPHRDGHPYFFLSAYVHFSFQQEGNS